MLRWLEDVARTVTSNMEDAFDLFVETGKLQVRDMVDAVIRDLSRLAFRQFVSGVFGLSFSAGGGRSGGGRVFSGMAFLVGERGEREWSVPKLPGMVVPKSRLNARGVSDWHRQDTGRSQRPIAITFNVTTPDTVSFQRTQWHVTAMLNRAVSRGARNI